MSDEMRKRHNIPEEYTKDGKLTLCMRKHLHMDYLGGVYVQDVLEYRGTLTKAGFSNFGGKALMVFPNNIVEVCTSEISQWRSIWK